MEGKIFADSVETYQVNIININQKIGSVSNQEGKYSIKANVGDSILFTSLQHKTYTLKVEENNLKTTTSIFLELEINELPEVTINQYQLSGDLSSDIDQVKVDFVDQRQFGFGVPRQLEKVEREIYSASTGMLTPLIYAITGEAKVLRKRKANADIQSNKNRVLRNVSADLITKDLNIPRIYVDDFAYFCAEDEQTMTILEKNDPLALIDELKLKAIAYLKLKEITE
ncbi:carboxypeptidase-like regulatory domain-containing protein [Psychroflexus sp. CAK8W]|uniref:Carboxypeptidase-like regulatory domain-containing protein n=1 Tax=Psychroflexus longus TaxID=2873596 RepID=A0ABS7XGH9_9FLAO|nr:carboxypeptidase-like regulatory domain-containing protein [Psychroflexus longus]MBZ9778080.1 carboxypeptidase-like regulatory domain-containing protein [Psychroflexus longus]